MTVQLGRSAQPLLGPWQECNITYPSAQETLLSTAEALPTSEPTDAQVSYTVASSDIPTIEGAMSWVNCGLLYVAGLNSSGSTLTVNVRLLKNGTSVTTGNKSVATSNYYTFTIPINDIAVDDVLTVKIWTSASGVTWDYKAFCVQPSRIQVARLSQLLVNCAFTTTAKPVLSLGSLSYSSENYYLYFMSSPTALNNNFSLYCFKQIATYNVGRISYGDNTTSIQSRTSTTYHPYYYRNFVPTKITYRLTPPLAF